MAFEYYINGERGTSEMKENTDEKAIKENRKLQVDSYHYATMCQLGLIIIIMISYITAFTGLFNGDHTQWFTRHALAVVCLGFIGVISAIKSLFKHEITD